MQWCPAKLVYAGQRSPVGHQREDTLVLGRGRGVVERGAAVLVPSIDVGETHHVENDINTLNVTRVVGGKG